MGHHISAIVIAGDIDALRAAEFDAKIVPLLHGFTAIALIADYVDAWAERLGIPGAQNSIPLLNFSVVHHIASELANGRPFALIETDYFGGRGTQSAAVYHADTELLGPTNNSSAINDALRRIGVTRNGAQDEFDTVGLGDHRHWDDLFDDYFN